MLHARRSQGTPQTRTGRRQGICAIPGDFAEEWWRSRGRWQLGQGHGRAMSFQISADDRLGQFDELEVKMIDGRRMGRMKSSPRRHQENSNA